MSPSCMSGWLLAKISGQGFMQIVKSLALRKCHWKVTGCRIRGSGSLCRTYDICTSLFQNVWGWTRKGFFFPMVSIKGKSYIVVRCLGVTFEPRSRKENGSARDGEKELLTEEGQQIQLSLGGRNDGSAGWVGVRVGLEHHPFVLFCFSARSPSFPLFFPYACPARSLLGELGFSK